MRGAQVEYPEGSLEWLAMLSIHRTTDWGFALE